MGPAERVEKIREREEKGKRSTCITLSWKGNNSREICLDTLSGGLVRHEWLGNHRVYKFGDYAAFGSRSFPREIGWFDRESPLGEIHVEELSEVRVPDMSLFMAPSEAGWRPWCLNPNPASLLSEVMFEIPRSNPNKYVVIYGIIGSDGLWHNLTVLESGGRELDSILLRGLRKERYRPATCNGVPIETEVVHDFPPF